MGYGSLDMPYPGADGKGSWIDTTRYNPDGSLKPGQSEDPDPAKRPGSGKNVPLLTPGAGGKPNQIANGASSGNPEASQATRGGVNATTTSVDQGVFGGGRQEINNYSVDLQKDPNYEKNKAKVAGLADTIAKRKNETMTAATAAGGDLGAQDQTRARQNALLDQLAAQASGKGGPSAAEGMLKMGADRAQAASLARAAAGGTAGARRQASFEGAAATQDAAGQAAVVRAQEQQAAQQLLGQTAGATRAQDQTTAQIQQQGNQFNAGLAQDAGKTNLLSGVEQQKAKDAQILALTGTGLSLDEANRQYEINQRQFNASLGAQQEAAKLGVSAQAAQSNAQAAGAGAAAVGTTLAAALPLLSDAKLKKNITDGDKDVEAMLDQMHAKGFVYKDPAKGGAGHREGVLAQDVEKSPMGAAIVVETPEGKGIDKDKALSATLASLANINKRLRSLGA